MINLEIYMKKNFQKEYPEIDEIDLKSLIEWWNTWKHLYKSTINMPPPPFRNTNKKKK